VLRRIDVIRGRIVDIGEPIPRRRIERVGHQRVGLGELADGQVIKTRPVIPFAMLRGGCALVQAESLVPALTGEQAVGDAGGRVLSITCTWLTLRLRLPVPAPQVHRPGIGLPRRGPEGAAQGPGQAGQASALSPLVTRTVLPRWSP
jgi:hypothetical protein